MRVKKLTEEENLFCYYMVLLKNPIEAAIRAGYEADKAGSISAKLLGNTSIRNAINALLEKEESRKLRLEALGGLWRIAFGMSNDAVKLLTSEQNITDEALTSLDLYGVSEIKKQKGGGLEIQFFDRLKALELLLEWSGDDKNSQGGSIYDAILNSAAGSADRLSGTDDSDAV